MKQHDNLESTVISTVGSRIRRIFVFGTSIIKCWKVLMSERIVFICRQASLSLPRGRWRSPRGLGIYGAFVLNTITTVVIGVSGTDKHATRTKDPQSSVKTKSVWVSRLPPGCVGAKRLHSIIS